MTTMTIDPRATGNYTPPDGRWWRIQTTRRGPPAQRGELVTELGDARARKIHFDLFGAASAECVIDGRSPQCATIAELSQDLVLYRWNPYKNYPNSGAYDLLFRGPIGRTQDTVSETVHTVNISAVDYRGFLHDRLPVGVNVTWTSTDQATMVRYLVQPYGYGSASGAYDIGYTVGNIGATGVLRDRTYSGAQMIGSAIDDLAACINGFEWSVEPYDPAVYHGNVTQVADVRVWYPTRGGTPPFVAEYGATVSSLTRTVNSQTFANWILQFGANVGNLPMVSSALGDVVNNPQLHPEGLWPETVSSPDVSVQATLDQQAQGRLALDSVLQPSYTVVLTPGVWTQKSDCWLGDTITLRVKSGRLAVDTAIRIIGIDFDVDDAGIDRISLTVGRPDPNIAARLGKVETRLDALGRR